MAVIGISPCRKLEDYRQSVLHVGSEPRVLDLATSVEQALAGVGGLLLPAATTWRRRAMARRRIQR